MKGNHKPCVCVASARAHSWPAPDPMRGSGPGMCPAFSPRLLEPSTPLVPPGEHPSAPINDGTHPARAASPVGARANMRKPPHAGPWLLLCGSSTRMGSHFPY